MATSEAINIDAILNLKKVVVDKGLSSGLDKILEGYGIDATKNIINSLRQSGYSYAAATTAAQKFAEAKAKYVEYKGKAKEVAENELLGVFQSATFKTAEKELRLTDKIAQAKRLAEMVETAPDEDKSYVSRKAANLAKSILYGDEKLTKKQQEELEKINKQLSVAPKKEANEFKKIFGIKELLTTAEAVSSKKDTEIPVSVLDGAINAAAQMGGPITQILAGIAKVASAGVKKTYKDAAKTYQKVTMYGGGYSTQVAEQMEGAKTGFTEEHYEKLADQSYMFGARTAFGEIGERQWTGLAYLPNYMQGLMSGASPEELVRLLESDRALSPNDAFFRQYLSMAAVPEEVLGWLNLAEKEKARIETQEIKEEEIRRRADAAAKIQGSVEDPSFWKGTSGFWSREGQEWGDLLRNPGYFFKSKDLREKRRLAKMSDWSEEDYEKAGVPKWAVPGLMRDVKEAEGSGVSEKTRDLLSRQAAHASSLTDGGRNTIVNVRLDVDGTTMFEGSQTQKEVLESNYRFVGGAQ